MTNIIVQTASAKMPSSVKAQYRRVAVIEVIDGQQSASMISERARGVLNVLATWERCNVGLNIKSAYTHAVAEAEQMADGLFRSRNYSV